MKNIVILGFMGTGKSAVSKMIAEKLNLKFTEMDQLIEEREGTTINEIFKNKGESYFRNRERELVKKLSQKENQVISSGGGVVLNEQNILDFKKNGILISLWAKPKIIFKRVKEEGHRPLLKTENPLKTIRKMLDSRKLFYKQADYMVDTSNLTIAEVVAEILKLIKR